MGEIYLDSYFIHQSETRTVIIAKNVFKSYTPYNKVGASVAISAPHSEMYAGYELT